MAQPLIENGSAIKQPLAKNSSSTATAVRTPSTVRTGGGTSDTSADAPEAAPPPLIGPRVCPLSAKHAWCDGRCHVPRALHVEFQRLAPESFELEAWYAEVDLAFAEHPIGDDMFDFWRARWREKWGTTRKTEAVLRAAEQRAETKASGEEWLKRDDDDHR